MSDKHKLTLETQVQQSRKVKALTANVSRLTAENAKLREALRQVEVFGLKCDGMACAHVARRALADADTGEGRG